MSWKRKLTNKLLDWVALMKSNDLKRLGQEAVQVAGAIYLIIALAALPFLIFGFGLSRTSSPFLS